MSAPAIEQLLTLEAELIRRESGDPLDPDAELTSTVVGTVRCELQQTVRGEALDGRLQSTTWRAFLPGDVELTGWDALRVDGVLYELEGDPWQVRHPRGGTFHHVECELRRVR